MLTPNTLFLAAGALCWLFFSHPVQAQQLPGLNRTPTPSGWEYTQPSGPNLSGTPQPLQPTKPPNWGSGAAPAGSHYRATGSGFEAGGTYRNPVPGAGGKTIDVSAKWPVPKAAVAKKLAALLPFAGTLIGLHELITAVGYRPTADGGVERKDPDVCTTAPCYGYYGQGTPYGAIPLQPNERLACEAIATFYGQSYVSHTPVNPSAGTGVCTFTTGISWMPTQNMNIARQSVSPQPTVWEPATLDDLENAIANYENPEILNPALRDASNHPNWEHPSSTSNPTLSGPSSTPGGSKQTNHPDGKVSTSTTTYNHTYNQNKTYHTTTTVTNIYNPTTDTTETTTEETEEPPDEDQASPTDTPLADVPELYEQKYPDGISGVWNERKADLMGSPVGQLLDVLMPNLGSGGTCPSWSMNLDITDWAQFGTHDISPPCWLWEFAYWCVIVSALLLARSLVFGG